MSITFFCPAAPKNDVPCPYCTPEEKCWDGCTGRHMQSEAPECNFANANATPLLALMGLPVEPGGDIPVEKLGNVRQRLLVALNRDRSREPMTSDRFEFGGPGTGHCRFVICEQTDEQVLRRLNQLMALVVYAQERNFTIAWG